MSENTMTQEALDAILKDLGVGVFEVLFDTELNDAPIHSSTCTILTAEILYKVREAFKPLVREDE